MNEKVSIIIPAYNTEKYIDEMLLCVIKQTYKNLEIIIINDGSTDSTLDHINSFAKSDDRIIVVNVPNGGVSRARNIGLEKATGNKIFFWDSDDIIELDAVEKCLIYSEINQVNSVLYGYSDRIHGINGEKHHSVLKPRYVGNEIRTELMKHFIGHSFKDIDNWIVGKQPLRYGKEHTALWRIMLDAKVIRQNNIWFNNSLWLGEDTIFINTYFLYESSIGYLDECLYHLTWRSDGANNTSNSNPIYMMENKIKLITARLELDTIAMQQGIDLHKYWEGTMILSLPQLLIKFATSSIRGGMVFLSNLRIIRVCSNR